MKKKIKATILALAISASVFFMSAINVKAYQPIYKGIDVYEGCNITSYHELRQAGYDIIIQKATQYRKDKLLYYRASEAPKYGFKIGYYHFANNTENPEQQAQLFIDAIQGLQNDTCLWLDIEIEENWSKSAAINFSNRFINYVQSKGYKCGIYTGYYFYKDYLQGNIPSIPLWIASYGKQPPTYSAQSWQYSESGRIPGVATPVDLNYFVGNIFNKGYTPSAQSQNVQTQTNVQIDNDATVIQKQMNYLLGSRTQLQVDGIMGNQTKSAVKLFQIISNITVDGKVGLQTVSNIEQCYDKPVVKSGDSNKAIRLLQYHLGIQIDGKFGIQTEQAVRNFQTTHGLVEDGIVGNQTWNQLLK